VRRCRRLDSRLAGDRPAVDGARYLRALLLSQPDPKLCRRPRHRLFTGRRKGHRGLSRPRGNGATRTAAGELTEYSYNPGRKISAFKEKASLENEQNLSVWEGPSGRIALKQIAGLVARRIVFDHSPGDSVLRGERIGLIRYGSRVDVFLPEHATILVSKGDRVRAGESPIAELAGDSSS
jgi:hypothetical protein